MQFIELAPFIIPGMLLQFFVQGYYIYDCIHHPRLSKKFKLIYALGIAVFSLPVAAYYLLKERSEDASGDVMQGVFRSNVRQAIFVLLVIGYEIVTIRSIAYHMGMPEFTSLVWLSAIGLTVMILTELSIQRKKNFIAYALSIGFVILAFAIQIIASDTNAQLLVVIIAASMINNYPLNQAKKFIFVMLLGFVVLGIGYPLLFENNPNFDEIIGNVYLNTIVLILVVLSFYMLKHLYVMNHRLTRSLRVVEKQSEAIEELSATEERNKIAKEIHDTVGHRLTGALYMIDVAKLEVNEDVRNSKLTIAHGLIKDALADIRHSVKLLVEQSSQNFDEKLTTLLEELSKNTELSLNLVNEVVSQIPSIHQRILLRALMECCTNTIKHSQASEADILIQESVEKLLFSYTDNGKGNPEFSYGFGLSSMKESVESLGGLFVATRGHDGFTVSIQLPLGSLSEGVHHE